MIANLVDNALNYVPHGGVITLRSYQKDDQGIIEVEDNGPGIPPGERESVFGRFYRLAPAQTAGSGLGLSIVREIARGLGGRVCILTPSSGQGCLVRIEQLSIQTAAASHNSLEEQAT